MVILLGTHFMFKEELGSRLRGVGYTVHPYDSVEDLEQRLNNPKYRVELVIVDLQHEPTGGVKVISDLKSQGYKVLALGEHKKTHALNQARQAGADRVIINSQASDSIETYVKEMLVE